MKLLNLLLATFFLVFYSFTSSAQFSFIHITDMHISDGISIVNGCDVNGELAHCYLDEFATLNPKPSFIVATGDISNVGDNSAEGMYTSLVQYLYPLPLINPLPGDYFIDAAQTIPIYFTPGNHDYYSFLAPPVSTSTLDYYARDLSPDTDYVVTTDIAVVVCMRSGYDDDRPFFEDPNFFSPEGSGLSNSQCHWLRNVLTEAGNKKKIIAFHHPAVNAAGTNFDGDAGSSPFDAADGCIKNNRVTFLNICDSNQVDIVLSGHEHQNVVADREGNIVDENWTNGTRYVQTSSALNTAYRVINVDPSFVTVGPPTKSCTITDSPSLSYSAGLKLYPNPASNNITVEVFQKAELEIMNLNGQTIKKINSDNTKTTIDISDLPSGIYFIKATTNSGITAKKFIKQ